METLIAHHLPVSGIWEGSWPENSGVMVQWCRSNKTLFFSKLRRLTVCCIGLTAKNRTAGTNSLTLAGVENFQGLPMDILIATGEDRAAV